MLSFLPQKLTISACALSAVAFSMTCAISAQTVKEVITTSGLPTGIAINYVTNKVYVVVPSFGGPTDTVQVIDGRTDEVVSSIAIPPIGFLAATDLVTDRVAVGGCTLDTGACSVVILNGKANKVIRQVPITQTPGLGIEGIAIDPVTGQIFVANASDNEIDVVNEKLGKVVSRISLGGDSPFGLAVDVLNQKLYATLGTAQVDEIDISSEQVVATATSGYANVTIAVDYQKGNLYIPNNVQGLSTVSVLSPSLGTVASVPAGNTPYGVDVDFLSNLAFVVNTQDGTVSVINGATNTVKTSLPVSGELVVVNPFTSKAYVTGQNNSVTVIKEK